MINEYVISADDADLLEFERLIVDFHPQLTQFRKNGEPSYEHPLFFHEAPGANWLPGNDDDYCLFAYSLFNKTHRYNYILGCHKFLETPYGRKQDKGIGKLENSFEELVKNTNSELIRQLSLLVEESCAIWTDLIRECVIYPDDAYIDSELQNWIIAKCQKVSDKLMDISKSDELEFGELKTLDSHGRYGVLAKVLIQQYQNLLPSRIEVFTAFWVTGLNDKKLNMAKKNNNPVKNVPFKTRKIPQYIDVVLTHHLVKQLKFREGMPSSPCDFIYKVINKNKKAKSRDLRTQYRWLFIKACIYAFLKEYSATLTDTARKIASDDAFFYMSDMKKLVDYENEVDREEIEEVRFLDLKNNLSAWTNNKSEKGYIYNQILLNSKDQT